MQSFLVVGRGRTSTRSEGKLAGGVKDAETDLRPADESTITPRRPPAYLRTSYFTMTSVSRGDSYYANSNRSAESEHEQGGVSGRYQPSAKLVRPARPVHDSGLTKFPGQFQR